jgi:hypothetical protein
VTQGGGAATLQHSKADKHQAQAKLQDQAAAQQNLTTLLRSKS